jgi:thiamine biosynthesis lipoprotein
VLNEHPHWQERRFRAMGTAVHLIVGGGHEPLVDWAVAEIERFEQSWSRFRPDSELCRLNARPGEWVPVSADLLVALQRARALWRWSAGAFDPSVLPALEALGYDRTFVEVERDGGPVEAGAAPGLGEVEIDEAGSAVRLPAGVRLDLGGVGKGLAADLVAEGLVLRGAASALVGLGGDIRAAGDVPEGGWRVPVQDPFDAAVTWRVVPLGAEAIVTSTSLMRRWRRGGASVHHIVDPLTGASSDSGVVAMVARGESAWWAEGLAKATMVLGEDAAEALLDDAGVEATIFRSDRSTRAVGAMGVRCSQR